MEWTGFVEVTSGTPDLSVSIDECQAYAESVGTWNGPASFSSTYPIGCMRYGTANHYYNANVNTDGICGHDGKPLIQNPNLSQEP